MKIIMTASIILVIVSIPVMSVAQTSSEQTAYGAFSNDGFSG